MLKTLSLLWMGSLLGAGAAFLTQVILARQLGPATLGAFTAVLAAVTMLAPLAAFGVGSFWLKAFGKEGWDGMRWIRPSVRFSVLSTLAVIVLMIIWALIGPHDLNSTQLFLILSIYIASQAVLELTSARFQLEERYGRLALWQLTPNLLRLAAVGGLTLLFGGQLSAVVVAIAYTVVAAVLLVLGAPPIAQMLRGNVDLKGHNDKATSRTLDRSTAPKVAALLRNVWPFGLANIVYLLYFQSNLVLTKYLAGDVQAGLFNVAFIIMSAAYIFPSVIYQKYLLPKFHRWSNHDVSRLRKSFSHGNVIMLISGIVVSIALLSFAQWGLELLFGKSYEGAVSLLMILALAVPARFVSSNASAILMTKNNLSKRIIAMTFIALLNTGLGIALIPKFGAVGASISIVISEIIMLIIFYSIARRNLTS